MLRIPELPNHSILGLNYSGMHDTTVAIVSPQGSILFACSLERISRVKQDGRPPTLLLQDFPWDKIETIAVSTDQQAWTPDVPRSLVHPLPLKVPRLEPLIHGGEFRQYLDTLPAPKEFVCHELCHVSSAFWLSGFEKSLCFSYDGGMSNCPWFGGLYDANRIDGMKALDRFAASHYAKIASLYAVVTGLLGFTPLKHEGKLTGLAAYGSQNAKCRTVLLDLFEHDYDTMESMIEWVYTYSDSMSPMLFVNEEKRRKLAERFEGISKEDIAATLQRISEEHVVTILNNARDQGWRYDSICLAGGLFANVRINQKVKELGFRNLFVAPPMTDDGTALGAALHIASQKPGFRSSKAETMFFGYDFSGAEVASSLHEFGLKFHRIDNPANVIADKLAAGAVVGVFQGRMEFGPRALGNRSIICQATQSEINNELNKRLCRTEFMPFAPMTRLEDAKACYEGLDGAEHAAEFMTITFNCTELMKRQSPAVVHVDGTARPQLINEKAHPFIYDVITAYQQKTGIHSIVNTSFNIHEEPIICSPSDAIEGFLTSGLDFLYMEGGYLVDFQENQDIALAYLQRDRTNASQKEQRIQAINQYLAKQLESCMTQLGEKESVINVLAAAAQERLELLQEKEKQIGALAAAADERLQLMQQKDQEIRRLSALVKK
ncbi:MAG: hypothetical protein NTY15_18765 [Planctomycetota bacterium]|nr:hypothetical protein [Planctomycetota bacterium]